MSGDEERRSETLPVDAVERLERVCSGFEAAWRRGETPSIEQALGETAGPERTQVLRELLFLDIDCRWRRGGRPRTADYTARFPEDVALVEAAFASIEGSQRSRSNEPARQPALALRSLDPKSLLGTRIGPYKLLEVLGDGGMGVVYLAEQQAPIRRRVVLKLIKRGMDTAEVIARFEAERQALALMSHPNIAKVHDAGTRGRRWCSWEGRRERRWSGRTCGG